IEGAAEAALGGPLTIGGTAGDWPSNIILTDVAIADSDGVWAQLPFVQLAWRPLSPLFGGLHVETIAVRDAELTRLPPAAPEEEIAEAPDAPRTPPSDWPTDLPNLRVDRIDISDFQLGEAVLGQAARLSLTGAAQMQGGQLAAKLDAKTGDGADALTLSADYDADADRLALSLNAAATPDGVAAALAGPDVVPLSLTLEGTAPASDWRGALKAAVGEMATVEGDLTAAIALPLKATIALTATPGAALPSSDLIGEAASLKAALTYGADEIDLSVEDLSAAAGRFSGDLAFRQARAAGVGPKRQTLEGAGAIDLGAPLAPLAEWLGARLDWRLDAVSGGGAPLRDGAFRLQSDRLTVDVAEAAYSKNRDVAANLSARLQPSEAGPAPLQDGASLTARLGGTVGETLELSDAALAIGEGLATATASAAFDQAGGAINAALEARVAAALADALGAGVRLGGPTDLSATAEGPLDALSLSLKARTPDVAWPSEGEAPPKPLLAPGRWDARFRGLPARPTGEATVLFGPNGALSKALIGAFRATAETSAGGQTRLAIPEGRYASLSLTADALLQDGAVTRLNSDFAIGDLADFAPDGAAEGSASGRISVTQDADDLAIDAAFAIPHAEAGELRIDGAEARLAGPMSGAEATLRITEALVPGAGEIRDASLAARLGQTETGAAIDLDRLSLVLMDQTLSLVAPTRVAQTTDGLTIGETELRWGEEASIAFSGQTSAARLQGDLAITQLSAPDLPAALSGRASLDTEAEGAIGVGAFTLASTASGEQSANLEVQAEWDGAAIALEGDLLSTQTAGAAPRRQSILVGLLPLKWIVANGVGGVDPAGDMEVALDYEGALADFAAFAPDGLFLKQGALALKANASGPYEAPDWTAAFSLEDGAVEAADVGLTLEAMSANAAARPTETGLAATFDFAASDGRSDAQAFAIQAEAAVDDAGPTIDAALKLSSARLVNMPEVVAIASADLALAGGPGDFLLSGAIDLENVDAVIPDTSAAGPASAPEVEVVLVDEDWRPIDAPEDRGLPAGPEAVKLDLAISAPGRLFVRGRGLESEWRTDLTVTGSAAEPRVRGSVGVKRGALELAGRRFDITRGTASFQGAEEIDPLLDVIAETETQGDVIARLGVTGTATQPEIELSSEPALPEPDIMALILFGRPANDLTPIEALQAAEAAATLSGAGPLGGVGVFDSARRSLGLDTLGVGYDDESGDVDVSVGKYINDDIFVSASQDSAGAAGEIAVEYDITRTLSLKTVADQNNDQNIQIIWQRDY
ncbi:MAG: translocation/assembly module TamB domain-containing protein, partial [Pseudomonadota bacterium]